MCAPEVSATVSFRFLCCFSRLEHFIYGSVYTFCVKHVMAGCSLLMILSLNRHASFLKFPNYFLIMIFTFIGGHCLLSSFLSVL